MRCDVPKPRQARLVAIDAVAAVFAHIGDKTINVAPDFGDFSNIEGLERLDVAYFVEVANLFLAQQLGARIFNRRETQIQWLV